MVKSKEEVAAKMTERVSGAGKYMRAGMKSGADPLDVLLKDPAASAAKHIAGVQEAARKGKYEAGLKKAKGRDAWKGSIDRAANHYEERTTEMVARSLEDYDVRAGCIEKAKAVIAKMPGTTRDQNIQRSAAYQKAMGECMDSVKGLKA